MKAIQQIRRSLELLLWTKRSEVEVRQELEAPQAPTKYSGVSPS